MSEYEVHGDSGGPDHEILSGNVPEHGGTTIREKVFRDEHDSPIGFMFHKSVEGDTRRRLTRKITAYGGIVLDRPLGADTLLVDSSEDREQQQLACTSSTDKARARLNVESVSFVQRCIDRKVFRHTYPKILPMTGVPENNGRNIFTSEDFEHLAWFLSRMVPDPAAGGRQSLRLYAMLVRLGDTDPEYKWVKRHTAESWKEHNKKNKAKYHTRIAQLVRAEPPNLNKIWPYDRRVTKAASKGLQDEEQPQKSSEEEDEDDGAQLEPASRKRRISGDTSRTMQSPAKRPRTAYRNSDAKGKTKVVEAFEIEESEEEIEPRISDKDSLFDADYQFDDEPGPSTSTRSPERTLVVSAATIPSTRNLPTQETLVGTSRNSPSTQPFAARKNPNLPAKVPNSGDRTGPVSSSPARVTPRSSQLMPPPPEQAIPPPYRPPAKAARRRPVAPDIPDENLAPFRNLRQSARLNAEPQQVGTQPKAKPRSKTRRNDVATEEKEEMPTKGKAQAQRVVRASSRLRSVEPEILPLPGRRTAQKKRTDAIVEEEDERENPIGETLAEEQDVANLLAVDAFEVSAKQSREAQREVSMDTDDVHIARGLQASAVDNPRKFDFLARNPTDVLKRAQTASRRHPMHTGAGGGAPTGTQTPILPPTQRKPHRSVPTGSRINTPRHSQLTTPRTPLTREQRQSSAESFPLPGTRARTALEEVQRYEGSTPYKPPPGTRAAAAIVGQRF